MKSLQIYIALFVVNHCLGIDLNLFYKSLKKNYWKQKNDTNSIRCLGEIDNLKNRPWMPIRIQFEYLDDYSQIVGFDRLNSLIEIAINFYVKHLLVQRAVNQIVFNDFFLLDEDCASIIIPDKIKYKSYDADLVIYIQIIKDPFQPFFAASGSCGHEKYTFRPLTAILLWNQAFSSEGKINDVQFQQQVEIIIHEFTHMLGFEVFLFQEFYNSSSYIKWNDTIYPYNWTDKEKHMILAIPRLTNFMRKHYNCSDIRGAIMENEGGEGNKWGHFEKSIFGNEMLTPAKFTDRYVYSMFTFLFLRDTGLSSLEVLYFRFYELNSLTADKPLWGANKSCEFINKRCYSETQFPEFCYQESEVKQTIRKQNHFQLNCTFNLLGLGKCRQLEYNDGCKTLQIYQRYDCRTGPYSGDKYQVDIQRTMQYFSSDSLCFQGSLSKISNFNTAISCYRYSCDSDNSIFIHFDDATLKCNSNGNGKILEKQGFFGGIQCPSNTEAICESIKNCQNACNHRGFCMAGQCHCVKGFSGIACELECQLYRWKHDCIQNCPEQSWKNEQTMNCIGCPLVNKQQIKKHQGCLRCQGLGECEKCNRGFKLVGKFCETDDSNKALKIKFNGRDLFSLMILLLVTFS